MTGPSRGFRDCLGQFPTGVSVITVNTGDTVHGVTIGSFTSVSLDPPLVLVSVNRAHRSCARLLGAPFGANVLTTAQRDLALHFSGRVRLPADRIRWEEGLGGLRLAGCAAFLYCAPWAAYDGGDHVLYVGEVRYYDHEGGEPLVFHRGAFRELAAEPLRPLWNGSLDDPDGWLLTNGRSR